VGDASASPLKYHYFHRFFTYSVKLEACGGGFRLAGTTFLNQTCNEKGSGVPQSVAPTAFRPASFGRARRGGVCVCAFARARARAVPLARGRARRCGSHRWSRPGLRLANPPRDQIRGHIQAGSLTEAVHLSKDNAGVLRLAQRGQKPRVE
jgi:hypothetical protein